MAQTRSLRARVLIAGGLLFVSPLVFVGLTALLELGVAHQTEERAAECASEVADAWVRGELAEGTADACRRHHFRVRVLEQTGERLVVDDLLSSGFYELVGDMFYGPQRAEALASFEVDLPAVAERPETRSADVERDGVRCTVVTSANLRVCSLARRVEHGSRHATVHVIGSSRSGDSSRYALRRQLAALLLFTGFIAAALVWWLQRRVTGFVSQLARDVDALEGSKGGVLDEHRPRELAEVAGAFNRLRSRLARADAQNEAFLADLAHEMKNPVAAISVAAESLEAASSDDPERRARLGRSIGASATRLDRLIGQFLELARAEAGLPDEERDEIDLGELVRGVASVTGVPDGKELRVRVADGPFVTRGVSARLEGALRNLLDNAVSFARQTVEVAVARDGNELVITVHDDGPGIAAENLPRVFQRFFSARLDGRGTGLGLAIVQATLHAHGGRAEVSSTSEAGTSFVMRVPVLQPSSS